MLKNLGDRLRKPPAALGLVAAALALLLLAPRLLIDPETTAERLADQLAAVGLELDWTRAELRIDLALRLEGVELGGLRAETLILAGGSLSLEGLRGRAGELAVLAALSRPPGPPPRFGGTLTLPDGSILSGSWRPVPGEKSVFRDSSAVLDIGDGELELAADWRIADDGVAVHLAGEALDARVIVAPEPLLLARLTDLEATGGLIQLDGLQARGSLLLGINPAAGLRALLWHELKLRRPGQTRWFGVPPGGLSLSEDAWLLALRDGGWLRGDGREPRCGGLELSLDAAGVAALLPPGSSASGELGLSLSLAGGFLNRCLLSAAELIIEETDGALWRFDGGLDLAAGTGSGSLDCGGGALRFELGRHDGGSRLTLSGEEVELRRTLEGLGRLLELLETPSLAPLSAALESLTPLTVVLEPVAAAWGKHRLGGLSGRLILTEAGLETELELERDGGRASLSGSWTAKTAELAGRWSGLPVELFNALALEELRLAPRAGSGSGSFTAVFAGIEEDRGLSSLELELDARGLALDAPPPLVALWRWCDTGREPPSLEDARLELDWRVGGPGSSREAGRLVVVLTSPEVRVNLASTSDAALNGVLSWRGVIELPPEAAAAMKRRGVLVFGTPEGWGAKPFLVEGSWRDPQVRLDPLGARELAAAEPPPGVLDW